MLNSYKKSISKLNGQLRRAEKNLARWEAEIEGEHDRLEEIENEMKQTEKEVSRLDDLIEKEAVKMQGVNKRLMDTLKMLARNAFYIRSEFFRERYDNLRDDHVIFRSLTLSGGWIEATEEIVTAHLLPEPDYPKHQRKLLEDDLALFTADCHKFPDGSERLLKVKFADPTGIEIGHKNRGFGPNH